MSTAFIKAVLNFFPTSKVDLIVKSGFEDLPLPHRGEILPFDKLKTNAYLYGKSLSGLKCDRIYVLPPSFSSALMAYSAKIPDRIGYKGGFRGLLLNKNKSYNQKPRSQHLIQEYLQLLDDYQGKNHYYPELKVNQNWISEHLGEIEPELPKSYISVAPGAIYGPAKQWPASHFRELISMLAKENINVVIIGTQADASIGEFLSDGFKNAINLCGKTSLNQLIAVLANSRLLVSNDSGTMHIMAALQKPQIAIFGSTSTIWTGPLNKYADVIKKPIDCSPCFKRECRFGHYNCLKLIDPKCVFDKIRLLLK